MYETMIYSCKKNNLDISKEEIQFEGFDQNNEHRQLSYADYSVFDIHLGQNRNGK
jgi:uncharacterized protein YfbU (UPF0304 family)